MSQLNTDKPKSGSAAAVSSALPELKKDAKGLYRDKRSALFCHVETCSADEKHCWTKLDPAYFKVRGPSYLTDVRTAQSLPRASANT